MLKLSAANSFSLEESKSCRLEKGFKCHILYTSTHERSDFDRSTCGNHGLKEQHD